MRRQPNAVTTANTADVLALAMSGAALVGERSNRREKWVRFLCSIYTSMVWTNYGTPVGS